MQLLQKQRSLFAIQLSVMKLKGEPQFRPEPAAAIAAPREKRIVENPRVLVDDAVQLGGHHGRRAENHGFSVGDVAALAGGLLRQQVVVAAELLQIVAEGDIATADASRCIFHDDVDAKAVELVQLVTDGKQVE